MSLFRLPVLFLLYAALFLSTSAFAQNSNPFPTAPPPPPGQDTNAGKGPIQVQVNLVVLHTTVLDDRGRFAEGLKQDNFRVFEDTLE